MNALFAAAPLLYFAATDDGVLSEVNDYLCSQLGYQPADLVGKKQDIIFTLPTRIFQQTHFYPLLKMQNHAEEIFISLLTKEKTWLPVLINATRKEVNGQAVILYAGIVVQNRKKFEDELIAAKKTAEAALSENTALVQAKAELQKQAELLDREMTLTRKQNEELRQFNHVVTHELQEPLRKLFLFTDMFAEAGNKEIQEKAVSRIQFVSGQMRAILSGLQQYIWLTEKKPKQSLLNINGLLQEAIQTAEKENPGVLIEFEADEVPPLLADREQMQFLWQELVSNAIRFRKPSSIVRLWVEASSVQMNDFKSITDRYHFLEFLKITFTDNGLGFDDSYQEQAFALFKRLHAASGNGVGLSLCRKVVENHQGSITITSKAGVGTTVTIILPFSNQQATTTATDITYKISSGDEE